MDDEEADDDWMKRDASDDEEEVFDIQVSLCDVAMSWSDVMSLCDVTMSWCVAMVCRNGVLQVTGTTFSLNKVQKDKDTGVARRV